MQRCRDAEMQRCRDAEMQRPKERRAKKQEAHPHQDASALPARGCQSCEGPFLFVFCSLGSFSLIRSLSLSPALSLSFSLSLSVPVNMGALPKSEYQVGASRAVADAAAQRLQRASSLSFRLSQSFAESLQHSTQLRQRNASETCAGIVYAQSDAADMDGQSL